MKYSDPMPDFTRATELTPETPEIEAAIDEALAWRTMKYPNPMPDFTRATELTPEIEKAIDEAFEYHPWGPAEIEQGRVVRTTLAQAVKVLVAFVPACPDRTAAIRKIREARMDANSAITHGGKY